MRKYYRFVEYSVLILSCSKQKECAFRLGAILKSIQATMVNNIIKTNLTGWVLINDFKIW